MTYRHVGLASCISCLSNGVNKLATDTKVTKLDMSMKIEQDVGRLHIWKSKDVLIDMYTPLTT